MKALCLFLFSCLALRAYSQQNILAKLSFENDLYKKLKVRYVAVIDLHDNTAQVTEYDTLGRITGIYDTHAGTGKNWICKYVYKVNNDTFYQFEYDSIYKTLYEYRRHTWDAAKKILKTIIVVRKGPVFVTYTGINVAYYDDNDSLSKEIAYGKVERGDELGENMIVPEQGLDTSQVICYQYYDSAGIKYVVKKLDSKKGASQVDTSEYQNGRLMKSHWITKLPSSYLGTKIYYSYQPGRMSENIYHTIMPADKKFFKDAFGMTDKVEKRETDFNKQGLPVKIVNFDANGVKGISNIYTYTYY